MSRSPDQSQMTSFLSTSRKREALWNVLQPGDPYDIRKSMIAKVPGDKKGFMGDHLEIICLFQAAQIERLCQFLDDFKLKYRQIQRRELDRHSYEVQIKQLTHKLAQQGGFRQQNEKLRQFLKNQSSTKQGMEDSIKSKYEKLLLQIKSYQDDNLKLKRENQQLSSQSASFDAKFQALQKSKQTEMDELYMKFSQQSSMSSQGELNSLRGQYQAQVQRLDLQNKRLRHLNQDYGRQIQGWQQRYRILEQQLPRKSPRADTLKYEKQINQYESRFVLFGQQIDRLNLVIQQITSKFQITERRNQEYEARYDALSKDYILIQNQLSSGNVNSNDLFKRISQLQAQNNKLQQSGKYVSQYEVKLKQMSEQINRLNGQLRIQIDNGNRFKADIQKYQYEQSRLKLLQKDIVRYQSIEGENGSLKMKIAEDQNRIAILKQEIQRLREQLARKGGQDNYVKQIVTDFQKLQKEKAELQRKYQVVVQQYESKISLKTSQYESRIQSLNRTKGTQFQTRAAMLQSEVQRLGQLLKRKNEQVQAYQRQIRELQYNITNKYQIDVNRKLQGYESGIQSLKQQNQDLISRVRELEPLQRRINEFENKSTITSQEIDRLNLQLRSKDNEIQNFKRQIREQQITIVQRYEMDTSRKLNTYETNLNNINRENQQYKRKYSEIENKAALLSQQIQRLSNNMRQLQNRNGLLEQEVQRLQKIQRETQISFNNKYEFQINQKVSNFETVIKNSQRENQQLRRRIVELQNINRKIPQYENRLSLMAQELQRVGSGLKLKHEQVLHSQNNNRNLAREYEELGRKFTDLQNLIRSKYEVESARTITTLEQNVSNLKRQNEEVKKYLQQYENRFKGQNSNLQTLNLNLRNLGQQNELLKKQIRDTQNAYRSKLQVEVTGKYQSYQKSLSDTRKELENIFRENNQLKRILQNAEQTNIRLNQENQELRKRFQQDFGDASKKMNEYELRLKQYQAENEGLKRRINELDVLIRQKYQVQASKRISSLDQNLANAGRQNEDLRRKLEQAIRDIEELTRVIQARERENQQLVRRIQQYGDVHKRTIEYQNKTNLLLQQIQKANIALKQKSEELLRADKFIKELTIQLQNAQRNMNQSQSSIQQFEIDVKNRITQYEQNIGVLNQQNNELKRRLQILDDANRKIAEYENKIVIINQELQRVTQNLRSQSDKSNQLENALRNIGAENEELKRKLNQLQNNIAQKYEIQATRAIKTLEQNIDILQKENNQLKNILRQFEQKGNAQGSQLQKLTLNLRSLSQQNNALKNQLRQADINIKNTTTQVTTKYSSYERDLTNFRRDNEQLVKKLRQYAERVVPEYQNQVAILKQELERLNQYLKQESTQMTTNLRNAEQQNQNLKRQLIELQQTVSQKLEVQVRNKYSLYEQNIGGLQKENEELKRYINQVGVKYETDMKGLVQNLNSLQKDNQELKRALNEIGQKYEFQIKKTGNLETTLTRQNEELKRRLLQLQQQLERLVRKLNEFQQQNQFIKKQSKQTQIQLTQRFQADSTQQINIYKQQIVQIQRDNEELQRRLNEFGSDANKKINKYEDDTKKMITEIQRLNSGIRQYDAKLRQLSLQNEGLRRQVKDTQIGVSQKWQLEFKNKQIAYEQNIQNMSRQLKQRERGIYENSNKRVMELQNKTALLAQELQRLNLALKAKSEESQKMRLEIERLNNALRLKVEESRQFEAQITKFKSSTQNQFTQLQASYGLIIKENENYKKHLSDYENSIKKLYVQFERLQNIINELKKERQALFEKNYALSNQIDRLLNENKDLESQVEDVRLKLSDQAALNKRINEHMGLMVILFAQIESLRKRVKDKEKQVEDVRRSSLAPFKLESRARGSVI